MECAFPLHLGSGDTSPLDSCPAGSVSSFKVLCPVAASSPSVVIAQMEAGLGGHSDQAVTISAVPKFLSLSPWGWPMMAS